LILDGVVSQWHPCCYMISKLWNIRLHNPNLAIEDEKQPVDLDGKANFDPRSNIQATNDG
jgi:hypothetical protein